MKRLTKKPFVHMIRVLLIASALTLLSQGVVTAAASGGGPPKPPPGFEQGGLSRGPLVKDEIITLSPAECATADPDFVGAKCQLEHRVYGFAHHALPAGTQVASSSLFGDHVALAAAAYWYWWWTDEWCSIYGCWYLNFTDSMDGVANGSNVYQWNHGCSAGGLSSDITWCGYSFNGGGWPNYAMQFGLNGRQTLILSQGTVFYNHGIRDWVNDWGNLSSYSKW